MPYALFNDLWVQVCMGHPGTLPVLNRQVVDYAILAGERRHCGYRSVLMWMEDRFGTARRNLFRIKV